jgi:outer membrane protein TolC
MAERVWRNAGTALGAMLVLAGAGVLVAAQPAGDGGRPLALDECLRAALSNNLDLVSARRGPAISEQGVTVQDAAFDPALSSGLSRSERQSEQTAIAGAVIVTQTTSSDNTAGTVGVGQKLKFGGTYSADFGVSRFALVNSGQDFVTYDSNLALSFGLPLLGDSPNAGPAGREATLEQLELARRDLDISREQLRVEAHRVLEQVEGAYWDVFAAREALRIAKLSLGRAQDLLVLNRRKVEVGTLAPIEITQAQAGVAAQEEGVIVAETDLENAEDELLRLMAVPQIDPLWAEHLVPLDRPRLDGPPADLEQDMQVALEQRPELATARQQLRKDELSERVARRKVRAGLGLAASLTPSGVDSRDILAPPPLPDAPDAGDAIRDVPKFDNYDWSLGLQLSYPIGNRAARAGYAISTLTRERSQVDLLNQEQTVRVDVRRAVRAVESAAKRVSAARENVRLQTEKLHAEEKKFENGLSTSFEVLTFQNDLADAELALTRAELDQAKALTGLERAKGTLLKARGLSLAP